MRKVTHSFEVHWNESACRKMSVLGWNKSYTHNTIKTFHYFTISQFYLLIAQFHHSTIAPLYHWIDSILFENHLGILLIIQCFLLTFIKHSLKVSDIIQKTSEALINATVILVASPVSVSLYCNTFKIFFMLHKWSKHKIS